MDFLTNWIRNIVLVIIFANFIEMLLPNNNTKREINMVIGLFIILVILSPIINLLNYQSNFLSLFNIFNYSKPSFEEIVQEGEKLKEDNQGRAKDYKRRLNRQIEALIKLNSDLTDIKAKVDFNSNSQLKGVSIKGRDTRVKKVSVDLSKNNPPQDNEDNQMAELKELIASFYGIDTEQITIDLD
ncbi:stage III sporulation protein AF [Orenia metallireducens]|jgi:stage III sporulation protein AF|uniref:Stage III sporulation protein AF n=1 Tax=Orenia metallireducens TaxID=1413210 RepID=A0A1C0A9J3_9FIRM|nr:stage III sporulation protein AF [Orenia metallireducens]OCL26952.1 stage III sporulation protein AF [Orenia metallireducens]